MFQKVKMNQIQDQVKNGKKYFTRYNYVGRVLSTGLEHLIVATYYLPDISSRALDSFGPNLSNYQLRTSFASCT